MLTERACHVSLPQITFRRMNGANHQGEVWIPPVAHAGALVWQLVLEELLAGEVLEIRVLHPAVPKPAHPTG